MDRVIFSPRQFHRTNAQSCPYLDGRSERKIITELTGPDPVSLYNYLSRAGFRRSHRFAYHPACLACNDCHPVRVVVDDFEESRWTKRIRRLNDDLTVDVIAPRATSEQYRLFSQYQFTRHGDSDMANMNFSDYRMMVEDTPLDTVLVIARDSDGNLMAACLIDRLDDGCSAVYSFFNPNEPRRSLGTWLVLQLIDQMRAKSLPYIYLGYWIPGSPKMNYKRRFKPLEALRTGQWGRLPDLEPV